MTRISLNKIANSKIDGYNVRAYSLGQHCLYRMDFVNIPSWEYVLLVYKNKTNFRDVMVEIREMDDAGNINQIPPELIKSILPSDMKNNYYELNGVAYIRDIGNLVIPTINISVASGTCGYRFIVLYGNLLQIMKKWPNVIHTYEEANEVYNLILKIREFKHQISENGNLNMAIKRNENLISNKVNEISEHDIEFRELYTNYENELNFIGSYGIDTKPFEIVD